MRTLFISDLHLSLAAKDIRAYFQHFLHTEAQYAEALYILGDFFEVWVGDDDPAAWISEICEALKQLNIKIYLMQGNRDFLLGQPFAAKCGAVLLPDPVLINLYGVPTVLTHGDSLCIEDVRYQRWRTFSHNAFIQKIFLQIPLQWRQKIAVQLRKQSRGGSRIVDVNAAAAEKLVQRYAAAQLIHGHTHQPAVHYGETYTRFVLPDWHPQGGMLVAVPDEMPQLHIFK